MVKYQHARKPSSEFILYIAKQAELQRLHQNIEGYKLGRERFAGQEIVSTKRDIFRNK